jgi:WhiB family redox-sensing transcriptional regulator
LSTSVATTPTGRAEIAPAVLAVQGQRLPQLLDTVAADARCATAAAAHRPDDWFRGEGEPITEWRHRRKELLALCAACPVRAACKEAALRQGDGSYRTTDDMVRGGHTAAELYQARQKYAKRLAAARAEDQRAAREEKELQRLASELRRLALVHRDSRSDPRVSEDIRATTGELRAARHARRVRSGWSSAA